jgi:hypothetical protein
MAPTTPSWTVGRVAACAAGRTKRALADAGAAKWKAAKPLQIGQCVRGFAGCGVFALPTVEA